MAYIGRDTDKISNVEVLDNITFDGSSSYTLQKGGSNFTPSSANTLLLSIDGVVQAGNFTVSGSTIDFGTAVAGTSTCDFILHYGVGLITLPSDGTVTSAKLATLTSAMNFQGTASNMRLNFDTTDTVANATPLMAITAKNKTDSVAQLSMRRESAVDDGYIALSTQPTGGAVTERVRIHSNGVMSAANGIALGVGTANTASNVLDDYEEGTWTPGVNQGTINNVGSTYTKIGNKVTIWSSINTFSNRTSTETVEVSGLPFSIVSQNQNRVVGSIVMNYSNKLVHASYSRSNSTIAFYISIAGAFVPLKFNDLNNSASNIIFTATYEAA